MTTDNTLRVGTRLRGAIEYTIVEPLHSGGFGITYKATAQVMVGHIPQTGTFTIKEFFMGKVCSRDAHGCVVTDDANRQLFRQAKHDFIDEAQVLHSLRHEGIVPVNEVFEQNGTAYYVMSYLGTTSLYAYVAERGGMLAEEEAKDIVRQLASAVAYLHNRHMLHLDIKPENIMMVPAADGSVKPVLIDFGQAMYFVGDKPKHDKGVGGYSKGYSAPEQKSGVTAFRQQLDIYSVAATLLYMLSGVVPCDAAEQSMRKIYKALPENISQHTTDAIVCAMQQDPGARPRDIASFLSMMSGVAVPKDGPVSGIRLTDQITDDEPHGKSWLKNVVLVAACIVVACLAAWLVNKCNGTSHGDAPLSANDTVQTPAAAHDSVATQQTLTDISGHRTESAYGTANTVNDDASLSHNSVTAHGVSRPNRPSETETHNSAPSHNVTPSKPTPSKPASAIRGTVNLGYATWTGGLLDGKPHGSGRMVFRTEHRVSGCNTTPVAGDYIEGFCENGVLVQGSLYHNGEKVEYFIR